MSKFVAYLQQGQGCDYTIGCGNLLWEVDMPSMETAVMEVVERIAESCSSPETRLQSCKVFQVIDEEDIDLKTLYNELNEQRRQREIVKIEEKEKQELERLSKKYGTS